MWPAKANFGLISSPVQACTCLEVTAKIHALMYPFTAAIVIADSYMDDIADLLGYQQPKQASSELLLLVEKANLTTWRCQPAANSD